MLGKEARKEKRGKEKGGKKKRGEDVNPMFCSNIEAIWGEYKGNRKIMLPF